MVRSFTPNLKAYITPANLKKPYFVDLTSLRISRAADLFFISVSCPNPEIEAFDGEQL